MTISSKKDFDAIAGEQVTVESCPEVIPHDQLAEIYNSITFIEQCFCAILKDYNRKDEVLIVVTQSPAISCRLLPLGSDKYIIVVPLGILARVRVLARLLLRYWDQESGIMVIRPPLDDLPDDGKSVPELLQPIFWDFQNPDSYWDTLQELDEIIEVDPNTEPDVRELVHLSLVYLVSHEFIHVLHGHYALIKLAKKRDLGFKKDELKRGLELDADDGAASISMNILIQQVEKATNTGYDTSLELGLLRLSYVVTMLFAIFDTHRKYLGAYDKGYYNHPIIRRELFRDAVERCLDAPEPVLDTLLKMEMEGWRRCVFAFNDLNVEALRGTFGEIPKKYNLSPLHSLLYSTTVAATLTESAYLKEAKSLMFYVRRLLPVFRNKR